MPNSQNLTNTKKQVIVEYIVDLVKQGFPRQLQDIANIANSLRAKRRLGYISLNQASTFVSRQKELKVKFNCKYNYKRAFCKDSRIIQSQFSLVANIKAKYSIQDNNTYNFDEIGFIIGQISTKAVVTALGLQKQLKQIQLGNREQATVIQGINTKGQAIPPFIIFKARNYFSNQYKDKDLP